MICTCKYQYILARCAHNHRASICMNDVDALCTRRGADAYVHLSYLAILASCLAPTCARPSAARSHACLFHPAPYAHNSFSRHSATGLHALCPQAGGVGLIIVNVPGGAGGTFAEVQSVPTVHLLSTAYDALVAYAATADATATLGGFTVGLTAAPYAAGFSSRGPAQGMVYAVSDLLKPVGRTLGSRFFLQSGWARGCSCFLQVARCDPVHPVATTPVATTHVVVHSPVEDACGKSPR